MKKQRKRTPKERVLARYPRAGCFYETFGFVGPLYRIRRSANDVPALGEARTHDAAWADAASRLPKGARNNQRGTR